MHTNWCVLIEISMEIGMLNFWLGLLVTALTKENYFKKIFFKPLSISKQKSFVYRPNFQWRFWFYLIKVVFICPYKVELIKFWNIRKKIRFVSITSISFLKGSLKKQQVNTHKYHIRIITKTIITSLPFMS